MANLLDITATTLLGEALEPRPLVARATGRNTNSYYYKTGRLPFFLFSPENGLFVAFPLAPTSISFSKSPKYEDIVIPGYHTSIPIYSGSDARTIQFEAFFDRTQSSVDAGLILIHSPGIGCLDILASIDQLIYPGNTPRSSKSYTGTQLLNEAGTSLVKGGIEKAAAFYKKLKTGAKFGKGTNIFYANPTVYLVAGTRYWKCLLKDAPITELRHNKLYVPTHISINFTFTVLEDGAYYQQEYEERYKYGEVGSLGSRLNIVTEILNTVLPVPI